MSDPTRGYPPPPDPAYSGQYWGPPYYGPGYGAPMTQPTPTPPGPSQPGPMTQPTQAMPPYWQTGYGYPPGPPPPPPQPPKSPRWPWVLAAAAVLVVAGLVFALLIVSNASRESTVVAPLPQTTSSSAPRVPTTTRVPTRAPIPAPTEQPLPTAPSRPAPAQTSEPGAPIPPDETPAAPAVTENVMYTVSGEGRAINITYVDSGGVMQTEFNVALPWSKQVGLEAPAKDSASVAVVNVGRDVTCSVTVNGAQIRQRTGRGLTICTGIA